MQEPLSAEQEAQAQELAAHISEALASDVLAIARLLVRRTGKHTFGQTEFQLRDLVHRAGAKALETSLAQKNGYVGSGLTCPRCGRSAPFKDYRTVKLESLLGTIRLRRTYYHCGACSRGYFPFDGLVGLSEQRLTPGAERLACLLGVACNSFDEAATKVLPEACGLHLAEATVQRASEDAGARLGALLQAGHTLGSQAPWDWHKDKQGRTVAYVSADATGVRQQAPGGGPAEGRMPYVVAVCDLGPRREEEDLPATGKTSSRSATTPGTDCMPLTR